MATAPTLSIPARAETAYSEDAMRCGHLSGCGDEPEADSGVVRGILLAVPAGLLLWAALLKVAGAILQHL